MRIGVTDHACRRYRERVKDHLTLDGARSEIRALLQGGEPVDYPPEWAEHTRKPDTKWLEVSDGLLFVFGPDLTRHNGSLSLVTVLTRGSLADPARAHRRRVKQSKRRARAAKRFTTREKRLGLRARAEEG